MSFNDNNQLLHKPHIYLSVQIAICVMKCSVKICVLHTCGVDPSALKIDKYLVTNLTDCSVLKIFHSQAERQTKATL